MAEEARVAVQTTDWQGMFSNADPHKLQFGQSTVQVNAVRVRPGELYLRGGLVELQDTELES